MLLDPRISIPFYYTFYIGELLAIFYFLLNFGFLWCHLGIRRLWNRFVLWRRFAFENIPSFDLVEAHLVCRLTQECLRSLLPTKIAQKVVDHRAEASFSASLFCLGFFGCFLDFLLLNCFHFCLRFRLWLVFRSCLTWIRLCFYFNLFFDLNSWRGLSNL